jgi:hypothetical protein
LKIWPSSGSPPTSVMLGPRAPMTTCSPLRVNSSASISRRSSRPQRKVSITSSRPWQTQSSRNPRHVTSGSSSPAAASKSPRRSAPKKRQPGTGRFYDECTVRGIPPGGSSCEGARLRATATRDAFASAGCALRWVDRRLCAKGHAPRVRWRMLAAPGTYSRPVQERRSPVQSGAVPQL